MKLHVKYIRSLEDSPIIRAACLQYLQTCLIYFYPEKLEIVEQVDQLARELGGQLRPPRLVWKYSWIKLIFGWGPAKRAGAMLPQIRWTIEKACDKLRWRLDEALSIPGFPGAGADRENPPRTAVPGSDRGRHG
jgi:hypothetical protein